MARISNFCTSLEKMRTVPICFNQEVGKNRECHSSDDVKAADAGEKDQQWIDDKQQTANQMQIISIKTFFFHKLYLSQYFIHEMRLLWLVVTSQQ